MSLLDDAFHLLEAATRLQKEGPEKNRIESATKVRTISIIIIITLLTFFVQGRVPLEKAQNSHRKFYVHFIVL